MSIFGRYLLKNYLKVFLLCVFSFITILLISRLEDIAHFAAMGAKPLYVLLFVFYQIPYILPIAIPLSCLISAMILFQSLSHTHELMALRTSGLTLTKICSPILLTGAFLSLGNFYITSELATFSHLATRKMAYEISSVNPLVLLQTAAIVKLRGAYVQMDPVKNGKSAKNLLIALNHNKIHLCLAKKLKMEDKNLRGEKVSIISSAPSEEKDHLVIENQKTMVSSASEFARLLRRQGWKVSNDHLKFSLLRVRSQTFKKELSQGENLGQMEKIRRAFKKCKTDVVRRISLGVAAFTFTAMGVAFGIEISRNQRKRGIYIVLFLTASTFIAFFMAKAIDHLFWQASLLFLLPHLAILLLSLRTVSRVNKGIE